MDPLALQETPERKNSLSAEERRQRRREERKALERFMDVIRNG